MAKLSEHAKLRRLIDKMQIVYPTMVPVKLVFSKRGWDEGEFGDCGIEERGGKVFLEIRINANLPSTTQFLVLWHEYAHALQWRHPKQEISRAQDHDPEWGIHLAASWEDYTKWYWEFE